METFPARVRQTLVPAAPTLVRRDIASLEGQPSGPVLGLGAPRGGTDRHRLAPVSAEIVYLNCSDDLFCFTFEYLCLSVFLVLPNS